MIVPGIGPIGAKIAFVGEAPGEEESRTGIPFVGASGQLLNSMLANAGIDRNSCYITNVVKQRPPQNDFSTFYLDPQMRQPSPLLLQSIEDLKHELVKIKPNIICPLGAEAFRALTEKTKFTSGKAGGPITEWRGSLLSIDLGDSRQQKLCSTLHPAHVLRMYRTRVTVEHDLRRVAEESISPELHLPQHQFELNPSFDRVIEFLQSPLKRISFDIETSGPFVRCLGIADSKDHALCIPFMSNQYSAPQIGGIISTSSSIERNSHWSLDQEWRIINELNRIFLDDRISKIAQNFPFDSLVLSRDFGLDCSPGFSFDTMVAQHTCFSELPKGLDYLVSIYTRIPYYSDFDPSVDRATWLYNCYDCCGTFEVADRLTEQMDQLGISEFYKTQVHPAILSYTRAETRGVCVDVQRLAGVKVVLESELSNLKEKIDKFSGGKLINPNSSDQLQEFFYNHLGLKQIFHHKTREVTMDKHARDKLRQKYPQYADIFNTLNEFKSKMTLLNSFVNRPVGDDGKLRTHYNVAGTVTGRKSSGTDQESGAVISKGAFGDVVNMQNLPRGDFRRIIISPPGFVFMKADLAQAEWLIVAWKAQIRFVIEKYISDPKWKIHRWVASKVFNKPEDQVQKKLPAGQLGLSEYDLAKNGVYGSAYGMMENTAAITWKVPVPTARFMLNGVHQMFPEIKFNYWKWIHDQLSTTRSIRNPLGRIRYFFDRAGDDMERDARSDFPQSTVGCIIDRAWNTVDNSWDDQDAYPLIQVHDEIVCCVKDDPELIVKYAKLLRSAMSITLNNLGPEPLIIPVEIGVGVNWYDTKEIE